MLLIPILALTQHCSGEARNLVMHMLSCSPSSSVLLIKYSSHIRLSKDCSSPLPSLESVATLMFFLSSFALLQKAEQIWDQEQREFTVKKNLSELRLLYQGGNLGYSVVFCSLLFVPAQPPGSAKNSSFLSEGYTALLVLWYFLSWTYKTFEWSS